MRMKAETKQQKNEQRESDIKRGGSEVVSVEHTSIRTNRNQHLPLRPILYHQYKACLNRRIKVVDSSKRGAVQLGSEMVGAAQCEVAKVCKSTKL